MRDIRYQDSRGDPVNARSDAQGRALVRLYGVDALGNAQELKVSGEGLLLTGSRVFATPWQSIPGIGAAAEYADEDAFGTLFQIEVPTSGVIQSALAWNDDDESIDVDLFLFSTAPASGTDNSPYAPGINDLHRFEGSITLGIHRGVSGTTISNNDGVSKSYVAPEGRLYVQAVARGALNMAAGKQYYVAFRVLADE